MIPGDPGDPIGRAYFETNEMRAALTVRDIGTVYHYLRRLGLSQRHLAQLTDQSQSEVSEILRGRQVSNVWLLARVSKDLEASPWFPQFRQFSIFGLAYYPRQRLGVYRSRLKTS